MSPISTYSRRLGGPGSAGLLLALAAGLAAPGAAARGQQPAPPPGGDPPAAIPPGEDQGPPTVWFTPAGPTVASASATVTIHWCDDASLSSSSRSVTVDGQAVSTGWTLSSYAGCGQHATSAVTLALSPGVPRTLAASVRDAAGNTGSASAPYTYATPGPVVTVVSPTLSRDPALCALDCGELVQTYSTPSYVSLDVPRSLTLVYRSGRAKPMPVVEVDVRDTNSAATPAKIGLKLLAPNDSTVTLTTGTTEVVRRYAPGVANRLAAQFDAAQFTNPAALTAADFARPYTAVVTTYTEGGAVIATQRRPVRVLIDWLNGPKSQYGAGWGIAGLQQWRLADGGLVLMDGDGTMGYWAYKATSGSTRSYTSPPGDFTTVTYDGVNRVLTRRYPDGTAVRFVEETGNQVSVTDRFGNATTFAYAHGANNLLTGVTDPARAVTRVYYRTLDVAPDGYRANSLALIQDPLGRGTSWGVTEANDLFAVTNALTQHQLFYYDAGHRLVQAKDPRGGVWDYGYDFAGTLSSASAPAVATSGGTARSTVRLRSPQASVLVDPAVSGSTLAAPAAVLGSATFRAASTDARGQTTYYALDRWGAARRVEQPLGRVTAVVRDDSARVVADTGVTGVVTTRAWDGPDLVNVYEQATGRRVGITYEPTYHQRTAVTGNVPAQQYLYWSGGRLDSTRVGTSGSWSTTRYTTDARGRVLTTRDGGGHGTTVVYEPGGLQNTQSVTTAGGRTTTYAYDAVGRMARVTDPRQQVTRTGYDALNRVVADTAPDGGVTRYVYDALYLTGVTDAKGQTYGYARNALGWLESDTSAVAAPRRRYAYDANGNVTAATNRRGQTVTFAYDALDQLASRTADGATVSYGTDPQGRWTAAGTDTVYVDQAGRPVTEAQRRGPNRYAVQSTYDVQSRRLTAGQPAAGMVARYHYGAAGQLDSLIDFGGRASKLGYDGDRMATNFVLANGVSLSTPTAPTHRRSAHVYSSAAIDQVIGAAYAFGAGGELVDRVPNSPDPTSLSTEYRYDAVGRLAGTATYTPTQAGCRQQTNADGSEEKVCSRGEKLYSGDSTVFAYDRVGNRTDRGAQYRAGSGHQLRAFDGVAFDYDPDGNLVEKRAPGCGGTCVTRYAWDALGQLTGVTLPTGSTVSYRYDGWGRRAWQQNPDGAVRQYVYDGDHVSAELNGAGSHVIQYAYYPGVDRPHSMRQGGRLYYFHQDVAGNVVGVTSAGGTFDRRMVYTPFGALAAPDFGAGQAANRLGFKGREWDDATGLYSVRARWYDPAVGRFISEDPLGLGGGLNPYAYAGDDPVNGWDPLGLARADNWVCVTWSNGNVSCKNHGGGESGAHVLDPVTVTADATPWGATANFLDPNARGGCGGLCGSDATAALAGAGRLLTPFENAVNRGAAVGVNVASFAPVGGAALSTARVGYRVGFKTFHAARHLVGSGLTSEAVEAAIRAQILGEVSNASLVGSVWGRVLVAGHTIEYRARHIGGGWINVGTYYIP